jgi:glycosyltransferase involved in cell wall biosynthesis
LNSLIFSVITVTYNAANVLEDTIKSVINQSYKKIEYIIIDGDSSDGTKGIIEKYKDKVAYWISEPDKGLYDAMNKGLKKTTGDYVWFLNAGDSLKHENTLSELTTLAIQNNVPDILYGETDLIDSCRLVIGRRRLQPLRHLSWKSFRMGMLVSHQAFIVKRKLAPEYDLQYRFSADFDWCIKCMKQAKSILNSKLILVDYLYEGMTTSNRKASLRERYAIMCKFYGKFVTLILHVWFAVRFYWAKCFTGKE